MKPPPPRSTFEIACGWAAVEHDRGDGNVGEGVGEEDEDGHFVSTAGGGLGFCMVLLQLGCEELHLEHRSKLLCLQKAFQDFSNFSTQAQFESVSSTQLECDIHPAEPSPTNRRP